MVGIGMNHLPNTLFTKPEWLFDEGIRNTDKPLWSGGTFPLPDINDRVNLTLNGWEGCKGTVVGYRVDDCRPDNGMWIGVCVRVDGRPDWHRKEMPTRDVCFFVGREVEAIDG